MRISYGFVAVTMAAACISTAASAYTVSLTLNSYTANPMDQVTVKSDPTDPTAAPTIDPARQEYATGFNMTTGSHDIVAWCMDLTHYLMPVGATGTYDTTTSPYTNSYGLASPLAIDRIQAVFDANYATLDVGNSAAAAAFQLALWEAGFEGDSGPMSLTGGTFLGSGYTAADAATITSLADQYLSRANQGIVEQHYNVTYLQSSGTTQYQNLVTVSPVPLPAGGLLLLTALGGLGVARRRRRKAA